MLWEKDEIFNFAISELWNIAPDEHLLFNSNLIL